MSDVRSACTSTRPVCRSTSLRALVAAIVAVGFLGAASAQGLRPEIGKPLQQASDLLKSGNSRDALAKVREAERVPGRNANEQLTIDRMKAAAAQRAGDFNTAVEALESIHGKVSAREAGQVAEQIASAYAQQRNTAKATLWLNRAIQAGNNSASIQQLQSYLQAAGGDYKAIAADSAAAVSAAEKAGRRPDEGELLRLADAQQRMNQANAYVQTLEKLLLNYPKKDYWNAYLGRLTRKPGFADRYSLDVLRLRLASGTLTDASDYMEMAQLALQQRLPAEALRIVEQGYKAGVLGTGAEAARQQRLRDLAVKRGTEAGAAIAGRASEAATSKTGDDLVEVGQIYVSMGQADTGIKLIQQGIEKGGLKRPEEAKLRLGQAQLQSAKTKNAGLQTLRSVKGNDGVADIARLWTIVG
ncbi:MAG: hypothetical protein ABIN96_15705 [Rubrivivax sp.]